MARTQLFLGDEDYDYLYDDYDEGDPRNFDRVLLDNRHCTVDRNKTQRYFDDFRGVPVARRDIPCEHVPKCFTAREHARLCALDDEDCQIRERAEAERMAPMSRAYRDYPAAGECSDRPRVDDARQTRRYDNPSLRTADALAYPDLSPPYILVPARRLTRHRPWRTAHASNF
jgi:hypothetical protein